MRSTNFEIYLLTYLVTETTSGHIFSVVSDSLRDKAIIIVAFRAINMWI